MYCSSCGTAAVQGLSYCNHCGAKLDGATGDGVVAAPSELFPDSLIWAIVAVFVIGLGCIIGLMAVMKHELNFGNGLITFFSMLSFALMLAVEGVFIWLLLSRRLDARKAGDVARRKEQVTGELAAAQARALPEPVPSVTEHTTRKFEPLYSERKAE